MKHLSPEQLVELFYGELPDQTEAESHLESCPDCQLQFQELQQVASRLDESEYRTTTVKLDVERVFAESIESKSTELPVSLEKRSSPTWALPMTLAAMAAIAVLGFLAGNFFSSRQLDEKIESAVASHIDSALDERASDEAKRVAELERRLLEKIDNLPTAESQFKARLASWIRQLGEEQWRISQELQSLATNTDRAFKQTRDATQKNTRVLARIERTTGLPLSD